MVARGRNSTSDNHCAINRSFNVQRHGVNQFLASGNIDGTFKKLVGAFVKASFYHCVIGAADDVAGRMRMLTRARSCVALVDRVDLATPLSVLSTSTGLSAPAPAQRAGAQRLSALGYTRSGRMIVGTALLIRTRLRKRRSKTKVHPFRT